MKKKKTKPKTPRPVEEKDGLFRFAKLQAGFYELWFDKKGRPVLKYLSYTPAKFI